MRDWRLAGAVAAGGFGLLLVLPGAAPSLITFVLPFLLGVAMGGLVLLPFLYFFKDTTVWGRMGVSVIAALAGSFTNLSFIAGVI